MRIEVDVRIDDRSAAFTRKLLAHLDRNTGHAARYYRNVVRQDITKVSGSDNDDEFITVWRNGQPVSVRIGWDKPYIHSDPFQSPFFVHRELANSYRVVRAGRLEWLMGSDVPHSVYMEVGTGRMAPRPHLRRNLILHRRSIADLWCAPM